MNSNSNKNKKVKSEAVLKFEAMKKSINKLLKENVITKSESIYLINNYLNNLDK